MTMNKLLTVACIILLANVSNAFNAEMVL